MHMQYESMETDYIITPVEIKPKVSEVCTIGIGVEVCTVCTRGGSRGGY